MNIAPLETVYKVSDYNALLAFFDENHCRNDIAYSLEDARKWSKLLASGVRPENKSGMYKGRQAKGLWLGDHLLAEEGNIPLHWNHSRRVAALFSRAVALIG